MIEFYVVDQSAPCALSFKTFFKDLALSVVVLAANAESGSRTDHLLHEFEDLFLRQNCISGEHSIHIKPEAEAVNNHSKSL